MRRPPLPPQPPLAQRAKVFYAGHRTPVLVALAVAAAAVGVLIPRLFPPDHNHLYAAHGRLRAADGHVPFMLSRPDFSFAYSRIKPVELDRPRNDWAAFFRNIYIAILKMRTITVDTDEELEAVLTGLTGKEREQWLTGNIWETPSRFNSEALRGARRPRTR